MADTSEIVYHIDGGTTTSRQVGDETVVLDLARSLYFGLNETAGTLWSILLSGASRNDLTQALTSGASEEVDSAAIAADVDRFLLSLRENGLLRERRT